MNNGMSVPGRDMPRVSIELDRLGVAVLALQDKFKNLDARLSPVKRSVMGGVEMVDDPRKGSVPSDPGSSVAISIKDRVEIIEGLARAIDETLARLEV